MNKYVCINCGFTVEAMKGCDIKCYRCRRLMFETKQMRDEDLMRDEMVLCFENQFNYRMDHLDDDDK